MTLAVMTVGRLPPGGSGPPAKRKVSITLDADLVAELEAAGENLSAQVNLALRGELDRRRRQRALEALVERLDAEAPRRDPAADEEETERYMRLLGGPPA
ncbi:type II toxin-antitoxin system CcdA family antitoxin [Parafrankia sp. FMc2]|uniref:type II toxin-antitoxin system CcdA family antitoxin n=1 Tax=Parafrankia sp. FMc2 TaxID=3233196 RepID=UPI0034D58209